MYVLLAAYCDSRSEEDDSDVQCVHVRDKWRWNELARVQVMSAYSESRGYVTASTVEQTRSTSCFPRPTFFHDVRLERSCRRYGLLQAADDGHETEVHSSAFFSTAGPRLLIRCRKSPAHNFFRG